MSAIMGQRIKELRLLHHLTQSELADRLNERFDLNINKSMISKWESGKSDPYLEYAKCLAFHFKVSLDYLMGLTDSMAFFFDFNESEDNPNVYYVDSAVGKLAQELHDRPEIKVLFDATRNVSKEDIEFVINMLERMKK